MWNIGCFQRNIALFSVDCRSLFCGIEGSFLWSVGSFLWNIGTFSNKSRGLMSYNCKARFYEIHNFQRKELPRTGLFPAEYRALLYGT